MSEQNITRALTLLDQVAVNLFIREVNEDSIDRIAADLMEARALLCDRRPYEVLDDRMAEIKQKELAQPVLPHIKPEGLRSYKGTDVPCPKCGAKKGQPCVKMRVGRPNDDGSTTPIGEPAANTHTERAKKAKIKANPHLEGGK